jgi:hypothetical protein
VPQPRQAAWFLDGSWRFDARQLRGLAGPCAQLRSRLAVAWVEAQDLMVAVGLPGRVFEQISQ